MKWGGPGQKSVRLEVLAERETGNCCAGAFETETQLMLGQEAEKMWQDHSHQDEIKFTMECTHCFPGI